MIHILTFGSDKQTAKLGFFVHLCNLAQKLAKIGKIFLMPEGLDFHNRRRAKRCLR
jgi:hypothetical protein